MSFADDVQTFLKTPKQTICKTGMWVKGLEEEDRAAFENYLRDHNDLAALWRMCVKNGCEAAETQFRRHCRERCSCYRGLEIVS